MSVTPRLTAQLIRPASATQYGIGDIIANSATDTLVTPMRFAANRGEGVNQRSGRIIGASCVVEAASGTVVLPAFDLLIFRPSAATIPFTLGATAGANNGYPADNADWDLTAAQLRDLVAVIPFLSTLWRNKDAGATAAGTVLWQAAAVLGMSFAPYNTIGGYGTDLLGVLQATNTWNPTAIVNTFDFQLHVDRD